MKLREGIWENRTIHGFLVSALLIVCFFSNFLSVLNIDLGVLILTPQRLFPLIVAIYCMGVWINRIIHRSALKKIGFLRMFSFVFFLLWAIYGMAWLVFGNVVEGGATEVAGIIFITAYAFCFFTLINFKEDVKRAINVILGCAAIIAVLANVEAVCGLLLKDSIYYMSPEMRLSMGRTMTLPSVVFANTNDLCAFLLLNAVVIMHRILNSKTRKEMGMNILFLILIISPNFISASTIFGIAIFLLCIICFVLGYKRKKGTWVKKAGNGLVIPAVIAGSSAILKPIIVRIYSYLGLVYCEEVAHSHLDSLTNETIIENNIKMDNIAIQLEAAKAGRGTIYIRGNLFFAGLESIKQHFWTGSGPNGFREYMTTWKNREAIRNIVDPHNFIIEIFTQYGVFFFGGFIALYLTAVVKCIKGMISEMRSGKLGQLTLYFLMMVAFAFTTIMPSGFIKALHIWVVFIMIIAGIDLESKSSDSNDELQHKKEFVR